MPFYCDNPKFSTLKFMELDDRDLISFMIREDFNVNKEWGAENPVLHLFLANEFFSYFERFLDLIPERINPNLCDGNAFGNKSLLILLVMLVSNGSLPLEFIAHYERLLNFDYQDKFGRTALHYAVILGRLNIVDALLMAGASALIPDKQGIGAFEYLYCDESYITEVLKQIDIEPSRDIRATSNEIKDHLNRRLILQGTQLLQEKNIVGIILRNFKAEDSSLIKYTEENGMWGTLIGDSSEPTVLYMHEFAEKVAAAYHISIEEILLNQELESEEETHFLQHLKTLHQRLSGFSVLRHCQSGHQAISEYLDHFPHANPMKS
jgi:hypothetical protein